MKPIYVLTQIDPGFCRIVYRTKNSQGQSVYYCLQEDFKDLTLYRCSKDFEPEYSIDKHFPIERFKDFEIPSGDSDIETKVRNYIRTKLSLLSDFDSMDSEEREACLEKYDTTK